MIMRIRVLRQAAGMSQNELAQYMGLARTCVTQWENEVALPRARELPQLAEVLGCTIDELFENPNEEVKGKCWEKL